MATPESTLASVRHAVDVYRAPSAGEARPGRHADRDRAGHAWAGRGPTAMAADEEGAPAAVDDQGLAAGRRGGSSLLGPGSIESRELARLRLAALRHRAASGSAEDPAYSRAPRFMSDPSEISEEIDDLDRASREALTRLQLPDFNVPVSGRALKYVRFLTRTDRGRGLFESWLKRSGRYQDLILEQLRSRGLPEDLTWVAMVESGFDPRAKSPAGAVGLWQFMRGTGEVYGLVVDSYVDLRQSPEASTTAAAHHLRDLHQRFGSWDLAMAAYNMGYEQLLDAIDLYGTTDFNELARQRAIPSETAAYVPKIVAAALVANNLERYGFDEVKLFKPVHAAELSVPGGTALGAIAKAAGVSVGTLRSYNPHLVTGHLPPRGETVVLLPADTLSRARAALPALLDRRQPTDAEILDPAEWLGTGGADRKRRHELWNEDENLLAQLPKPRRRSLRSVLRGDGDEPPRADEALAPLGEEFGPPRLGRETVMYRVGSGDTLVGVARQFAVDIEDLARDNGLEVDDKLREGALLKLQVNREMLDRWSKQRSGPSGTDAPAPSEGRQKSAKKTG